MGTLSLSKMGRLFWLGRYTERVYTSLKLTRDILDADVDGTEADYAGYCRKTGIPNIMPIRRISAAGIISTRPIPAPSFPAWGVPMTTRWCCGRPSPPKRWPISRWP